MGTQGDTLANAGVLSMLKTSTDTGDIGALSFNSSHLPRMPERAGQRRQHPSRMSGSSHQHHGGPPSHSYAPSVTSRVSSNNREWDTASSGRRGSMTSMQTMPTFMSDTQASMMSGVGRPMGLGPIPGTEKRDSRSYSMTNAIPPSQLPRHRSATSLKSQGHEPRHYNGPPPPMPENRGPFVYPTRLKRPGYRSPSPAMSDTYSQGQAPPLQQQHMPRRHQAPPLPTLPSVPPMARPLMPTYNSDYGVDYPADHGYLNVPPPRAMSGSPVSYDQPPPPPLPPSHFGDRPGPMRPAPSLPMQHHAQRPLLPQGHSIYGPPRPMYGPAAYPVQQPPRRGHPQQPNVGPMAHHIFHNAARMARQVPQRTDTPMTDTGVPSSDPPSSSTAPTISSPPTPKDQSTIEVVVNPAFIDPALTDLPESTSDPVIPAKYFEYADGLERVIDDTDIEVHHASVPPSGFVQRVRAMLESRAAAGAAAKRNAEREYDRVSVERQIESYDFANPDESRFTVIEEFQSPVELPASPIRIAELPASPIKSVQRLTRDLVKAELAPSTIEVQGSNHLETATPTKDAPSPLKPATGTPGTDVTDFEPSHIETTIADGTEMPSSPPEISHKGSVTESVASSGTGKQSKVSGMDYALDYPPPSEGEATATDLGETETESCDPFALDADTITAQHREAKEIALRTLQTNVSRDPVSPILAGEEVSRYSAVSPIQTETFGIDATLQMAAKENSPPAKASLKPMMPGRFPDDAQPPPTPRTPRTYLSLIHI